MVPASLEVLTEEASMLLTARVGELEADESCEPKVDRVVEAVVLGS